MHIDRMRKIDYYGGVPLCLFATWLLKCLTLFRGTQKLKPKNVLLIELSEMGSTILAEPAMQKLKDRFGARIHFAIFQRNLPSLKLLNTVPEENIFTLREDSLFHLAIDTFRFLRWTREKQIDTVIDLELFSRFTALLTGLSGSANRAGFYRFHNEGLYRGEMLTYRVAYNPHMHIAKNFIALVNSLLSDRDEIPFSKTLIRDEEILLPKVKFSDTETRPVFEKIKKAYPAYRRDLHKIALINPNASELLIQRRWMPENYVSLMRMILESYENVLILITGAPDEHEYAESLKRRVDNSRCINFAGWLKLEDLPLLYTISHLMVSNDSGPGHFSAITEMPSLILFGPETPNIYRSLGNSTPIYAGLACSPCVSAANHRKTSCTDNVCLQVIKPEYVFDMIKGILES